MIQTNGSIIDTCSIKGLCYTKRREVIDNSENFLIKDIDLLPIVKRDIVGINNYKNTINISSSRGCPANCIYCAGTVLAGNKYRIRNIENCSDKKYVQ